MLPIDYELPLMHLNDFKVGLTRSLEYILPAFGSKTTRRKVSIEQIILEFGEFRKLCIKTTKTIQDFYNNDDNNEESSVINLACIVNNEKNCRIQVSAWSTSSVSGRPAPILFLLAATLESKFRKKNTLIVPHNGEHDNTYVTASQDENEVWPSLQRQYRQQKLQPELYAVADGKNLMQKKRRQKHHSKNQSTASSTILSESTIRVTAQHAKTRKFQLPAPVFVKKRNCGSGTGLENAVGAVQAKTSVNTVVWVWNIGVVMLITVFLILLSLIGTNAFVAWKIGKLSRSLALVLGELTSMD
ncbi:hypothetical protein HK100_007352 [Physocladia obscura]|uniref:Uncharacterized protein n=1 Tax=Physocladia obscura TaxID=109957 RepID=A0AAD5XIQ6_9FUNG|nr:hypothetical protein HK100_007352 [Physocladia obscura]